MVYLNRKGTCQCKQQVALNFEHTLKTVLTVTLKKWCSEWGGGQEEPESGTSFPSNFPELQQSRFKTHYSHRH